MTTPWSAGAVVSVVIGGVFLLAGLAFVGFGFANARRVARVVGDEYMLEADAATFTVGNKAVRIKEHKRESLIFLLGALALFMKALWSQKPSLAWLIGLLAGIGLARISTQMLPATVLVLGKSARGTLDLQARLNKSLAPFRAVSLLRVDRGEEILVKSNCFRVGPGEDWAEAVSAFCDLLPLVVLDNRDSTRYVEEELGIVVPRFRFKTVFVVDDKGREDLARRARAGNPSDPANDIVAVPDDGECVRLVSGLLLRAGVVPSREVKLIDLVVRDPDTGEWNPRIRREQ